MSGRAHKGWYTPRGLPHFDSPQAPQFITFRLYDSLPREVALARGDEPAADYRHRIETALDAGAGTCWLTRPELAECAQKAILHGCGEAYELHAYVIMPNHVHVLATLHVGCRLCDVVQGWKSVSARRINEALGRRGVVWQRDYFDRFVRDETHFKRVRAYIEANPVSAGLVASPELWRFGSAARSVGAPPMALRDPPRS